MEIYKTGKCVGGTFQILSDIIIGGQAHSYKAKSLFDGKGCYFLKFPKHGAPDDIRAFYKAIIERIPVKNRRLFALPVLSKESADPLVLEEDGDPFVVYNWFEGRRLEELLQDTSTRFSNEHAASIVRSLLEAANCLAKANIAHLDFSPANIMVNFNNNGANIKVIDFDSARLGDENGRNFEFLNKLTETMYYSSPEQRSGKENQISIKSDTYSIALILLDVFERLFTSRWLPFDPPKERMDRILQSNRLHPEIYRAITEAIKDMPFARITTGKLSASVFPFIGTNFEKKRCYVTIESERSVVPHIYYENINLTRNEWKGIIGDVVNCALCLVIDDVKGEYFINRVNKTGSVMYRNRTLDVSRPIYLELKELGKESFNFLVDNNKVNIYLKEY